MVPMSSVTILGNHRFDHAVPSFESLLSKKKKYIGQLGSGVLQRRQGHCTPTTLLGTFALWMEEKLASKVAVHCHSELGGYCERLLLESFRSRKNGSQVNSKNASDLLGKFNHGTVMGRLIETQLPSLMLLAIPEPECDIYPRAAPRVLVTSTQSRPAHTAVGLLQDPHGYLDSIMLSQLRGPCLANTMVCRGPQAGGNVRRVDPG